ncbi:MAG TPA: hypothetical protein PKI94_08555 [Candidatus Gastranaerophilaceae bacterium]|nr:hypothetical protein [Candidatus Gastranaerophilaceae bacterium]
MTNLKISFNGELTIRTWDDAENKMQIKYVNTKKCDDKKLIQAAKSILEPKGKMLREVLDSDKTKELDSLLEEILEQKMPNENFIRTMLNDGKNFFYMLTNPVSYLYGSAMPSPLMQGGIGIDFVA